MRLTPQQRYYYLKKKQNPTLPCCSGSQQKQLLTEHPLPSSFNFSYPLFSALLKEPPLFSSLNVLLCPLWGRTPHFYPTKCGAYPFLQCAGLWKAQAPCKGTRSCPSETICWSHRQLARLRVCPAFPARGRHVAGIAACFWCSFPTALRAGVVLFLVVCFVPKTDICT